MSVDRLRKGPELRSFEVDAFVRTVAERLVGGSAAATKRSRLFTNLFPSVRMLDPHRSFHHKRTICQHIHIRSISTGLLRSRWTISVAISGQRARRTFRDSRQQSFCIGSLRIDPGPLARLEHVGLTIYTFGTVDALRCIPDDGYFTVGIDFWRFGITHRRKIVRFRRIITRPLPPQFRCPDEVPSIVPAGPEVLHGFRLPRFHPSRLPECDRIGE